jgi:hypothetical protein
MKLIIPVFFLLSGCTLVDAYLMAKFDSNEYQLVTHIKSVAEANINTCDNREKMNRVVDHVFLKGTEFKNYTLYIPNNKKATELASDLYKEINGLHIKYATTDKISTTYCKTKLLIIEQSAETIQEVIGDKPR